jgi:stage III sporulation protein AF
LEALSKWIYTIVVIIVFVTFIEILMPSSSLKKYTRVILGFLVMTIILSPLISLFNNDFSLGVYSFKIQSRMDSMNYKEQGVYSKSQWEGISAEYRQNLENHIAQQVKKEEGDREINVKVQVVEDMNADNYGEIKKIDIYIGKKIKAVEKVEKIEIDGDSEDVDTQKNKESSGYKGLKDKIAAMYDVSSGIISIFTEK